MRAVSSCACRVRSAPLTAVKRGAGSQRVRLHLQVGSRRDPRGNTDPEMMASAERYREDDTLLEAPLQVEKCTRPFCLACQCADADAGDRVAEILEDGGWDRHRQIEVSVGKM